MNALFVSSTLRKQGTMISLVPYEESSDSSDESEVEEKKQDVKKTVLPFVVTDCVG